MEKNPISLWEGMIVLDIVTFHEPSHQVGQRRAVNARTSVLACLQKMAREASSISFVASLKLDRPLLCADATPLDFKSRTGTLQLAKAIREWASPAYFSELQPLVRKQDSASTTLKSINSP
jgi:hypothetical protein